MIKEFLACQNTMERVKFLTDTTICQWSEYDLDVVLSTMGITAAGFKDKAEKLAAIGKHLADYKHNVMDQSEMDCSRMDQENFRDVSGTIFEPKPVIGTVKAAFDVKDENGA